MPYRVAIFGAGKMGRRHLNTLMGMDGLSLEIVDTDSNAARGLAEHRGIPWRDDPGAALADPGIDVAVLCTPVPLHGEQALMALDSGKHVFSEKPLCRTEERARAIQEAAERNKRVVQAGFLSRYAPPFVKVKEWLGRGLLGSTHLAIFRIGGRGSHRLWKHLKAQGGGVVPEMLTHKLDMAIWLLGPIEWAKTHTHENLLGSRTIDGKLEEVDAEDLVIVEAGAGDARILFIADFLSPSYIEYMEVHGENGSIFASMLGRLPTTLFLNQARGGYELGLSTFNFEEVDLVRREMDDFFEKVRSEEPSTDAALDALNMARALTMLGIGH